MPGPNVPNVKFPAEESENFILVEDISDKVSENDVREFFNFCGTIKQLGLSEQPGEGGSKSAVIEFEKPTAAKTSLLLDKALLGDRTISIFSYFEKYPIVIDDASQLSQEDKPKISIVSELLAKGYMLSDDIVTKAKTYDEQNGVSTNFYKYLDNARRSTTDIDEKYKVSETVTKTGQAVNEKVKPATETISAKAHQVSEDYHVQDNIKFAEEKIRDNLKFVDGKVKEAMETDTGKYVSSWLSSAYNNAQSMVSNIYNDSVRIYEEQKSAQPSTGAGESQPNVTEAPKSEPGPAL